MIMNTTAAYAYELHHRIPVVDAHNDLAGEILIRHQNGERQVLQKYYLPYWKAAGFRLILSSVYIENSVFFPADLSDFQAPARTWQTLFMSQRLCWENGYTHALAQIQALQEEVQALPDELCLVTSKSDLASLQTNHKVGILLYMEGLDCIGEDISRLEQLHKLGVCGASLTWSRQNLLATGCCTATKFCDIAGSITPPGYQVIEELQRLSMFLDISHLNNTGFEELQEYLHRQTSDSYLPYIATHSNCWSVFPNYRNLTDVQMTMLAKQGGIMGFNACKYIVGSDHAHSDYTQDLMCQHIEYAVRRLGANHVGFGFDLCDSYTNAKSAIPEGQEEDCLRNHEEALLLTARLLKRGMPEQTVLRIIGLNWFEYFMTLLP